MSEQQRIERKGLMTAGSKREAGGLPQKPARAPSLHAFGLIVLFALLLSTLGLASQLAGRPDGDMDERLASGQRLASDLYELLCGSQKQPGFGN
jgi:hypothetical protein